MPFFKKKKEELPPLPDLPPLPPLPEVTKTPKVPVPEIEEEVAPAPIKLPTIPKVLPKVEKTRAIPFPEIEEEMPRHEAAKVFVRIDKYKDVMHTIDNMQHKLHELQKTLDKISSIKTREAEIISGWNALLAEAKTKVDEVNSKLIKPEA